jgi:phosphoserine phosphatase RsbU/P
MVCRISPRLVRLFNSVLFLVACVALALGCPLAGAQSFDATQLRQPAELAGPWLVKTGDDPAYARPDFDDSQWLLFNAQTASLHTLFPHAYPKVVWYRLHLKVAPDQTGLALQEFYISEAFEIYANGVKVMQEGQVAPFVPYDSNARLLARIPDDQVRTGSVVIALRVHLAENEWSNAYPGFYYTNLTFGEEGVLREHIWLAVIGQYLLGWLAALIAICLSLAALLLFSAQRAQREYLWLFLLGVAELLPVPLSLFGIFHPVPNSWHMIEVLSVFVTPWLLAQMYFAFVRQRIGGRLQIYIGFTCLMAAWGSLQRISGSLSLSHELISIAPFILLESVILPVMLLIQLRRGNREAGILLIPLVLQGLYFYVHYGSLLVSQIPALRDQAWSVYMFTVHMRSQHSSSPFDIPLDTLSSILAALSLGLILLLRSNRMSRSQALLEGELAAAREVQQVILPEQVESVPGFTVESAYQPAQQVGGDFFQILPDGRGGMLIVIGDVAGKGLPAAMLVSVLVGATRTATAYSQNPAEILSQLNERLLGRTHGGFSTALAAHITKDGWVTIANAGHLSPYLDGREVALPGALPLGIVGNASYETTQFHLPHGSRLTFYSDGVVEAQNQTGELFGFDRARELSTRSAAEIAQAAKLFGQSDDITVVTIERHAAIATAA